MKRQAGFTLIELIMVIVILGILAATAAPKFASLRPEAEGAVLKGIKASAEASAQMAHGIFLAKGLDPVNDLSMLYSPGVTISMVMGYPDETISGIFQTLDLPANNVYTITAGPPGLISKSAAGAAILNCSFTYAKATVADVKPVIADPIYTGC